MVATEIEDSVQLLLSGEVSKWKERTAKWIDPETGLLRDRVMRVRGNTKNLWNTIDPVYGCHGAKTNEGHGCPWGCYAVFTAKKLKVDFSVP